LQTRKDLLQAHRLMTQRAGLALVQGAPDTAEQPLRRMNVATFAGIMVAALVAAVFGIIGAVTHSGGQLRPGASGTVILDSGTGTSYIWCGSNGHELCPAANYTSARLAAGAGGTNVSVQGVSTGSLARYPRGQEIGIPNLPPPPGDLIRGPWSVCVAPVGNATGPQQQIVTLVAGQSVGGQPVGAGQAVAVRTQNQSWIIWNDERLAVTRKYLNAVLAGAAQAPVPAQWLDSLAQGPDFAPPVIANLGAPAANGPNGAAVVGQVYRAVGAAGTQWYVQLKDGVAPISRTQAQLLIAETGSAQNASLSAVTSHPSHRTLEDQGLPQTPPQAAAYDAATPLCATAGQGSSVGQVTLNGTIPGGGLAAQGATGVNTIWLPPGRGALIGVTTAKGQQTASRYFLVAGASRYALASQAVAADLGYNLSTQATLVPVNIANLIPRGAVLDPVRARLPVSQQVAGG